MVLLHPGCLVPDLWRCALTESLWPRVEKGCLRLRVEKGCLRLLVEKGCQRLRAEEGCLWYRLNNSRKGCLRPGVAQGCQRPGRWPVALSRHCCLLLAPSSGELLSVPFRFLARYLQSTSLPGPFGSALWRMRPRPCAAAAVADTCGCAACLRRRAAVYFSRAEAAVSSAGLEEQRLRVAQLLGGSAGATWPCTQAAVLRGSAAPWMGRAPAAPRRPAQKAHSHRCLVTIT